jgi:flagellar biogenesis protein FliO
MEQVDFVRFGLSLLAVGSLIWLLGWAMKSSGLAKRFSNTKSLSGKLEVIDSLYLDSRRRLTLVRVGNKELLMLISPDKTECLSQWEPHAPKDA